jgi:hypothetical protein
MWHVNEREETKVISYLNNKKNGVVTELEKNWGGTH